MANGDYGYFGKGDTGYAQYMTAFNRNFGGSSGGGSQQWRRWRWRRQRLRLSHRHCGGGRAGAYRHGELRASPWHRAVLRDPVTENLTRKCYHMDTENTNNVPMGGF